MVWGKPYRLARYTHRIIGQMLDLSGDRHSKFLIPHTNIAKVEEVKSEVVVVIVVAATVV